MVGVVKSSIFLSMPWSIWADNKTVAVSRKPPHRFKRSKNAREEGEEGKSFLDLNIITLAFGNRITCESSLTALRVLMGSATLV